MSWRSTSILLATAAVLFAFIWWVDKPIREQRALESSKIILPGFDPISITNLNLKLHTNDEVNLIRLPGTNDLWQMTRPIPYAARTEPILTLLSILPKIAWEERISAADLKNAPDAQEKYGFADAQMEISVRGSNGSQKLLVGQTSPAGDQVYVEVVGNPEVYLVDTNFLAAIPTNKDAWRDGSLVHLAGVPFQSIQVRSPGKGFDLQFNAINGLWTITNPVNARADNSHILQLLIQLEALRVAKFVTDDPKADLDSYGLLPSIQAPELDVSVWNGTNLVSDLSMGASPTNHPELAYARRNDPSNIVVVTREPLKAWEASYSNFVDYHLISVSPTAITNINVQGAVPFSVQRQPDASWLVQTDHTFPADVELMRDWLSSFTNISAEIEKTVAIDVASYGLTHPVVQYSLHGINGILAQIAFGTNATGRIFEQRADEKNVNIINAEDFRHMPRTPWELRDRHIWSFDTTNVISLELQQDGAKRKFLRDPEGNWTFASGYSAPPAVNWPAVEEGVHRLGSLQAVYWSGVGEAALPQFGIHTDTLALVLELKRDGKSETAQIQFGGRSPFSYPYATVVKDGQRLIFEFPVDLYENFVDRYMTIPAALRFRQ